MDCCSTKEKMPGPKDDARGSEGNSKKVLLAALLIIVLLSSFLAFFLTS